MNLKDEITSLRFKAFQEMVESEWANSMKKELYYNEVDYFGEGEDNEEDSCDFTGEYCIGNRCFCEECPVLTDDWEEE
jgi:hypothetical protein